jgi:GDP-L-fucose synthase
VGNRSAASRIHADDVADACLCVLDSELSPDDLPVNIGTGTDCSIRELAELIARIVGFTGRIEWDTSKPDGAPQKLLDSSRLRNVGWSGPRISLADGIESTYEWFLSRERETVGG